jgi:MurNAc alpha-1-phosphate uridylyltransferase
MKAMILAAGEGTRLKPLTDKIPKALVEVNGKTLLEHTVNYFKHFGVDELIINVCIRAGQIIEYLRHNDNFNIRIEISDETDRLLDTGGGLKKASWFFNDKSSFFLATVDVITNLNLSAMYKYHSTSNALATLAVKSRPSTRDFLFDENNRLCGWKNNITGEKKLLAGEERVRHSLAFSGYHVINPVVFDMITEEGSFSVTDLYLRLVKNNLINCYIHNDSHWLEFGRIENVRNAGKSSELKQIISDLYGG